jgi:signal transduction histidine kinase
VISKGIVEEHGGSIWISSEKGKGSTFSFWLPSLDESRPSHPADPLMESGLSHPAA